MQIGMTTSSSTKQEYDEWTKDVWYMDTVSDRRHPAPFPVELPKRLIKLYSYKGNRILDPFVGRGTTLGVAEDLGRVGFGVELSKEYLSLIKETVGDNLNLIDRRDSKGGNIQCPACGEYKLNKGLIWNVNGQVKSCIKCNNKKAVNNKPP